ncbi:MAG: HD domain-containing protein [Eubacteriaceae bacterium]|nr:HD domain-containing protein [Eubacteriaceae bacterium]
MEIELLSTKEFRISEERIRHMHGVAEFMYKRAKDYKLDAEEMYLLGLLHDIGYIQGFEEGHGELLGNKLPSFLNQPS